MSPVLESTSRSQTAEMSDRSLSPPEQKVSAPFLGSQETELKGLLYCLEPLARRWGVLCVVLNVLLIIVIVVVIVVIIVIVIVVISVPFLHAMQHKPCPVNWVGYLGKCYYFSKDEADWPSSQSYCSTLGASLAAVDTPEEMDFMRRYGGHAGYWIGLHREPGQPWKWTSGTKFNDWFKVAGAETCAFMDDSSISSSSCLKKQRWICSK